MPVRIGTSGWSYDDWEGAVYPRGLAPGDRLRHLAGILPTLEIDSTFYRDPPAGIVRGWIAKTRDVPGFELSVKAPQALTHDALVEANAETCARMAKTWALLVAQPLADAGRLGAVLLQLSPAVLHGRETMARLEATLDALAPHPVAVEFRNRTWHDDAPALKADAVAMLDARDACAVLVDGPSFPVIEAGDATHAYARFHGRSRAWFRRGATRDERYDWLYAEDELRPWAERLARLARRKREVRAFFNNHVGGKAFRNAVGFERMVEAAGGPVARQAGPQRRLF